MFENIIHFFKKLKSSRQETANNSKDTAKERLHLVLMQDRANVSADFLDLMKQEIIEVIKKYIDVDESAIDVRLTNKANTDGTTGAPALYANIPIVSIKNEARKLEETKKETTEISTEENKTEVKQEEEEAKKIIEQEEKKQEQQEIEKGESKQESEGTLPDEKKGQEVSEEITKKTEEQDMEKQDSTVS